MGRDIRVPGPQLPLLAFWDQKQACPRGDQLLPSVSIELLSKLRNRTSWIGVPELVLQRLSLTLGKRLNKSQGL